MDRLGAFDKDKGDGPKQIRNRRIEETTTRRATSRSCNSPHMKEEILKYCIEKRVELPNENWENYACSTFILYKTFPRE